MSHVVRKNTQRPRSVVYVKKNTKGDPRNKLPWDILSWTGHGEEWGGDMGGKK